MKILVVYPYVPFPLDRGTHHRTFHLLREIAQCHEVHLLALAEQGKGGEFRGVFEEFCESVTFVPFEHPSWAKLFPSRLLNPLPSSVAHWTEAAVGNAISSLLSTTRFDLAYVCDVVMAQYFRRQRIPLVIDRSRVDLQFQLAQGARMERTMRARILRAEAYIKMWKYEREMAQRAWQIVCGPDDAAFVRRWIDSKVRIEVIPNGVDLEYFAPPAAQSRSPSPTLLFCGAMDYSPNVDAVKWFFAEMHSPLLQIIPSLRVLVVGQKPVPEVVAFGELPGVTVTGAVPDVRPYYRSAWLQIVPLRIGGGTRLKILESLAIGTPVISTSIGAQGLGLVHNCQALLCDTPSDFIRDTARALREESTRDYLSRAGRQFVTARYSWAEIGDQLNRKLEEIAVRFQKTSRID